MLILFAILAAVTGAAALAAYSYGRFAERALGAPSSALTPGTDTLIDDVVVPLTDGEPGKSGIAILPDGLDAFAIRAATAGMAGRSLDLMYYIWDFDLSGQLLAKEVLSAADRGVRVRMIIDDATTHGSLAYRALSSHPNIELRLFNPTRTRDNTLRRGIERALRFVTITRRMHNKAWIADGRIAIVGGRNIGDDYLDATASSNFNDMDAVLVGPVVQQSEEIFDTFWNSRVVLPMEALVGRRQRRLDSLRRRLDRTVTSDAAIPYIARVREAAAKSDFFAKARIFWSREAQALSDPPEKALEKRRENWLLSRLGPAMASATQRLEITAPYFVPGRPGTDFLVGLADKGISVSVLTNGLASTDSFPLAFAGYAGYRAPLIAGGVKLHELMPQLKPTDTSLFSIGTIGLHAKQFTVDDHTGFIGSFNFDPRSASLNTEMGVLFESPDLVALLNDLFARKTAPEMAFRLSLDRNGALCWSASADGRPVTFDREPLTRPFRRLLTRALRLLPVESQL